MEGSVVAPYMQNLTGVDAGHVAEQIVENVEIAWRLLLRERY
jgi:hypothetical protein